MARWSSRHWFNKTAQLGRSLVRNFRVEIEIVGVFLGLQFQFILRSFLQCFPFRTPPFGDADLARCVFFSIGVRFGRRQKPQWRTTQNNQAREQTPVCSSAPRSWYLFSIPQKKRKHYRTGRTRREPKHWALALAFD